MYKIATLFFLLFSLVLNTSAQTTNCELVAGFTINQTSTNNYQFVNTSVGLSNTDSIRWTFGDGSSSNQVSPSHTYAHPGRYNVCIRIQKRNSAGTLSNCVRELCHVVEVPQQNCELVASFTSTFAAPYTFHFLNTSIGFSPNDSIRWTFGDGTSSNQVNPSHTYSQHGQYNVCVRIQKRNPNGVLTNCVKEFCRMVLIGTTSSCPLVASFTSTLTGPNTFHFVNTSIGLSPNDSIKWTFGDGTSSNLVSPSHTYAQPGQYNVCIRLQKRNPNGVLTSCVKEFCHIIVVGTTLNCPLVAAFNATQTAPTTFHFVNTSIGLSPNDSIKWTFGDGTSSNQVSPSHTYAQPGRYNVCIRIQKRNPNGVLTNCVKEWCHIVEVVGTPNTCSLVASFTSTSAGPNTFHFQNTSIGFTARDSIRWTFGDGTSSNQVSPSHTYAQAGHYNVCIRIQKRNTLGTLSNCVREFCRVVIVGQTHCELTATFTRTLIGPNSYQFQNTTIGLLPTDSIRWTFGDGTSSNQVSPIHTYAQRGRYNVCLRVQRRTNTGTIANCVREVCHIVEPNSTTSCALPYPNPATNNINVQVPLFRNEMIHVYIYNASNVLVKQKHQQGYPGNNLVTLSLADLMHGVYTMKVIHENEICITSFLKL